MNYVVLSDKAYDELRMDFEGKRLEYGYTLAFDSYFQKQFSFQGSFCLTMRGNILYLIGREGKLTVVQHNRQKNCLYAKEWKLYEAAGECGSLLTQAVVLPGNWTYVQAAEGSRIAQSPMDEIEDSLNRLFQKNQTGFLSFQKYWEQLDIYNQKLNEYYERQEKASESNVILTEQCNQHFTLQIEPWRECYEPGAIVYVQISGKKHEEKLGEITAVDRQKARVQVECGNYDFINRYLYGKERIEKAKIGDAGSRVRIRRQREALKKLYQEETVNPHLREILMGEFSWNSMEEEAGQESFLSYLNRFGDNQGQADSFLKAVQAPDIFLMQGPPGTGKTTVITELVKYANQHGMSVLVSSETHIAVDNVLERVKDIEQVIPIRLGNEENMSSDAKLYVPERRIDAVWKQVEEMQREYGRLEQDFDWEGYAQKVEANWNEEIRQLEEEIDRRKEKLSLGGETEEVMKLLEKFPALLREALAAEQDFWVVEKQRQTLKNQMAYDTTVIAQMDYPRKKRIYERQLKRLDRQKQALQSYLPEGIAFGEWMYAVNQQIFSIRALEQKCAHRKKLKEQELSGLREDMQRKKELLERTGDIRRAWVENLKNEDTRQELEDIYIKRANAVFATCSGIASNANKVFARKQYDYCIIDEAAKCNTLDLIIPMTMGKKIIMVGDHKQLYPMLEMDKVEDAFTKEQLEEMKSNVLFKWLYEERIPDGYKTMLHVQYRMEKRIAQFVSQSFYHGKLQSAEKMGTGEELPDTEKSYSMIWVDSTGAEETKEADGRGYSNRREADLILKLLRRLDQDTTQRVTVGVIAAYRRQAMLLEQLCGQEEWQHLCMECSTVDAFQGKEKQIIIFNLVRSENMTSFVKDENRVNVAVSRAKQKLFVVGNASLIKRTGGILCSLYEYICLHGMVEEIL